MKHTGAGVFSMVTLAAAMLGLGACSYQKTAADLAEKTIRELTSYEQEVENKINAEKGFYARQAANMSLMEGYVPLPKITATQEEKDEMENQKREAAKSQAEVAAGRLKQREADLKEAIVAEAAAAHAASNAALAAGRAADRALIDSAEALNKAEAAAAAVAAPASRANTQAGQAATREASAQAASGGNISKTDVLKSPTQTTAEAASAAVNHQKQAVIRAAEARKTEAAARAELAKARKADAEALTATAKLAEAARKLDETQNVTEAQKKELVERHATAVRISIKADADAVTAAGEANVRVTEALAAAADATEAAMQACLTTILVEGKLAGAAPTPAAGSPPPTSTLQPHAKATEDALKTLAAAQSRHEKATATLLAATKAHEKAELFKRQTLSGVTAAKDLVNQHGALVAGGAVTPAAMSTDVRSSLAYRRIARSSQRDAILVVDKMLAQGTPTSRTLFIDYLNKGITDDTASIEKAIQARQKLEVALVNSMTTLESGKANLAAAREALTQVKEKKSFTDRLKDLLAFGKKTRTVFQEKQKGAP